MSEVAILAGFFIFVMTAIVLAGDAYLNSASQQPDTSALAEPEQPGARAFFAQAFRRVGESVPAAKAPSNFVRNLLMAAGYRYPSAVPVFYGIRSAAALVLTVAAVIFTLLISAGGFSILIAVGCAAGFGFMLPEFVLKRMIAGRRKRIRRAIPAALDLLVLSIESGQSLNQAVVDTSAELRNVHPDLSSEFSQVHLELRAGRSRGEALRELGARNGDPELKKLSSLLVDSDRFGTSLAPALRTHAKYLRTRMRQQAQEAARKVTVKLIFPVFFLIFPSVLLVTLGPAVLHMMKSFADFTR
jgi:tight adherence protein C